MCALRTQLEIRRTLPRPSITSETRKAAPLLPPLPPSFSSTAMADMQAEEVDDEGFGDFKFVTSPTTIATTTVSPSPNPAAASKLTSDEQWGDFFSYNGSPQIKSDPNPPASSNSPDPFGFFADRAAVQRSADVAPAGAVPEKPKWVKPSGAIPLSLFGEEEADEVGSGLNDSSSNGAASLFNHSNGDPAPKGPNLSSPVRLDDLISNLYNQNQQTSRPAGGSDVNLSSNGGKVQELEAGIGLKAELNPKLDSNGFDFNTSNGNEEQDDEDEWEFRAADAETRTECENSKGDQSKAEIGSELNFNSSFPSWNSFSSDLNGFTSKSNGLESGTNGFNFTGVGKQEDDFSWEFKAVEIKNDSQEGNLKVVENRRDFFEEAEPNFEYGNVVQESTGVNAESNKNSQIFGLDFTYDLNPKPGFQSSSLADLNQTSNREDVKIDQNPAVGRFSSDDDAWEFKEAAPEIGSSKDEPVVVENGIPVTSVGTDDAILQTGFHFEEDPKVVNGFFSAPANGNVESTDDLWGFNDALPDSNFKEEQRNGESRVDGKESSPLSTFGGGQLESNGSLTAPNLPTIKLPDDTIRVRRQPSNISINDLISSLYDQASPIASVPDVEVPGEIGFGTSKETLKQVLENELDDSDDSWDFQAAETEKRNEIQASGNLIQQLSENILDSNLSGGESRLMNTVNILDDSSWGFSDGSLGFGYGDQVSEYSLAEPYKKISSSAEIDDFMEFYSKLKDELCFAAHSHLYRMKEARELVGLPSEDATVEAQNKEIQELYNGLDPDNSISEGPSIDLRVSNLKGFLPVLGEKLQALEAEYQLSRKLLLAEEDPKLLIELLRHVSLMLMILRWGSVEEHSRYVSTWSKLISICNQELKHGALLWKQALEKDVQSQLLSKSQGKRYILALGEIYRVVGVLGASIKLYKPWILTSSADFSTTLVLLHECSLFWSSVLEEALRSMSDPLQFPYEGTITALLESIKEVHGLDEYVLQTRNLPKDESFCGMSLLSAGSVPDMKMIEWNGKEYFLKLANLWANLVSCDPPDLPRVRIS